MGRLTISVAECETLYQMVTTAVDVTVRKNVLLGLGPFQVSFGRSYTNKQLEAAES